MAHLSFQAGIRASYYKDNGDDATILLWLNDFMLSNTNDEIGFSHDELLKAIPDTLSEHEENTLLNWFADNYGTPYEEWYSGDADIIRQCTGLKDMTGKLIYDGDIVNTYYNGHLTGQTYIYYWENPAFHVEPFEHGKPSGSHWYYFAVETERCRVIGNIHENPELIGGNHD